MCDNEVEQTKTKSLLNLVITEKRQRERSVKRKAIKIEMAKTIPLLIATKDNINLKLDADLAKNLKQFESNLLSPEFSKAIKSKYIDDVIAKIRDTYLGSQCHEVEQQIGLRHIFTLLSFVPKFIPFETIGRIHFIITLCINLSSSSSLYTATAALAILAFIATKSKEMKLLLVTRHRIIVAVQSNIERVRKEKTDYDQITCFRYVKHLLETLTNIIWDVKSDQLFSVEKELCGTLVDLVDPFNVFERSLNVSNQPPRSEKEMNKLVISQCADDIRHLALNLLAQMLGSLLKVATYTEYCKESKTEIFENHLVAKDDRESDHFHMVSAMAVSIIAHDVSANFFLHQNNNGMLRKLILAGKEVSNDLLDHSMSVRENQRKAYTTRNSHKVRKENRAEAVMTVKETLQEIEHNSKLDKSLNLKGIDELRKVNYKHSKWAVIRNTVVAQGAISYILSSAKANKMLLAYCARTLWGWSKHINTLASELVKQPNESRKVPEILDSLVSDEIIRLLIDDLLFLGNEIHLAPLQISALACISTIAYSIPGFCSRVMEEEEISELIRALYDNNYNVRAAGASALCSLLGSAHSSDGQERRKFVYHDLVRSILGATFEESIKGKEKRLKGQLVSPLELWQERGGTGKLSLYTAGCLMHASTVSDLSDTFRSEDLEKVVKLMVLKNEERYLIIQYMSVYLIRVGMRKENEQMIIQMCRIGLVEVLFDALQEENFDERTIQHLLGALFVILSIKHLKRSALDYNGLEILTNLMLRTSKDAMTLELSMRCLKTITVFHSDLCETFITGMKPSMCPDVHDNAFCVLLQMANSKHSPITRICALSIILKGSENDNCRMLLHDLTGEETVIRCCVKLCEEDDEHDPDNVLRSYGCRALAKIALTSNHKKEAIYAAGGLRVMMNIALCTFECSLQIDALRGIYNLAFVPWIQHTIVKDYMCRLIKLSWTTNNHSIANIISRLLSLCATNQKNRNAMYQIELNVKSLDGNLPPPILDVPRKASVDKEYSLSRFIPDYNFDRDLRKPNMSHEVNIKKGHAGRAKLDFLRWLRRFEMLSSKTNVCRLNEPDSFISSDRKALASRGLSSTHASHGKNRLRQKNEVVEAHSKQFAFHTGRKPFRPNFPQNMRRSMKEIWIRSPRSYVGISDSVCKADHELNRWNSKINMIRAATPNFTEEETEPLDDDIPDLISVPLKVEAVPASPRSNFKFEKKTNILAPVDEILKEIQYKVKQSVSAEHSPLKTRKMHLIRRVDGSKVYDGFGQEHSLPDGRKVLIYEGEKFSELDPLPVDDPDEVKNMDVLSLMKQKLPDTPPPSFELTPVIRPYTAGDPPRKINFPNKSELMKREELLKN